MASYFPDKDAIIVLTFNQSEMVDFKTKDGATLDFILQFILASKLH
jgi:hypothetical protein